MSGALLPRKVRIKPAKITWEHKAGVWTGEVASTAKFSVILQKGHHPTVDEIANYERFLADAGKVIDAYTKRALEILRDEVEKANGGSP